MLMPAAAPAAWHATTAMRQPLPRQPLPRRTPPSPAPAAGDDFDPEATATGMHIIVSPGTLVPPAAAPAWKIVAALSGPAPRRARPAAAAVAVESSPVSAAAPETASDAAVPEPGTPATDATATETTPLMAADAADTEPAPPRGDREAALARLAEARAAGVEEIVLASEGPAAGSAVADEADGQPAAATPPARHRRPPRFDEVEDDAELPEEFLPRAGRLPKIWVRSAIGGLAVLALVVAGVHARRGELMRDPDTAGWLGGIYGTLGLSAQPIWAPEDLIIVSSEAVADSSGRLVVDTAFTNRAEFAQPYPILRVTLTDRWDQALSRQDFAPVEYLGGARALERMAAGELVEVSVSMLAAEPDAVGFNLDLCLEAGNGTLSCALDDG
jgi:hypothetical protein